MYKRILLILVAIAFILVAVSCEPEPTEIPESMPTQTPSTQPSLKPSPKVTLQPTPDPTPTEPPEPTPEMPDSAGSGDVLFDIYQYKTSRDLNLDGIDDEIEFLAGESESRIVINGAEYIVPHPNLAQLFAITDVDVNDDVLEIVFTDKHNSDLSENEFAFSWLYWWNSTEIILMGGVMDVAFSGEWRSGFVAAEHFDAEGAVFCLTDTDNFTYLLYIGHYEPEGADRKLKEKLYATAPVGNQVKIKCKQPCLLLKKITKDYYNSAYDFYWITSLWPYTAGRVPDVDEGISIIAQPGEYLTIVKVYGKLWFKLRTSDGYSGWIRCENNVISAYDFVMGWDADDMFSGL